MTAQRSEPLRILVSGMIAAVPHHGGATWAVLQYLLGFARLGHDVTFVEQLERRRPRPRRARPTPPTCTPWRSASGWTTAGRCCRAGTHETAGLAYERRASGRPRRRRADQHLGHPDRRGSGDAGTRACLPRSRPRLQPALAGVGHRHALRRPHPLRDGRAGDRHPGLPRAHLRPRLDPDRAARGARALAARAGRRRRRRRRVHDRRELARLRVGRARGAALRAEGPLDAGADGHPHAHRRASCARRSTSIPARRPTSRRSTATAGSCSTPAAVAHDPDSYRSFVAGSRAELGIAKSGYVLSRCGWFSDRSACYLASGRPVLAQDTGFPDHLPTGEGLLAFAGVDDAVAGIEEIRADYERHAGAARALAEAAPRLRPGADPPAGPGERRMSSLDETARTTEVRAAAGAGAGRPQGRAGVDRRAWSAAHAPTGPASRSRSSTSRSRTARACG